MIRVGGRQSRTRVRGWKCEGLHATMIGREKTKGVVRESNERKQRGSTLVVTIKHEERHQIG